MKASKYIRQWRERANTYLAKWEISSNKASVGAMISAFTLFSHLDTFINFSKFISKITALWREIIALPWLHIFSWLGFEVHKTVAGMLTVFFATLLVIYSCWGNTNKKIMPRTKSIGIIVCSAVGLLYSTLIIVPAFYSSDSNFAYLSIAISIMADIYYTDVDNVGADGPGFFVIVSLIIFCLYATAFFFNFKSKVSKRSKNRTWIALLLTGAFTIISINHFLIGYSPFLRIHSTGVTEFIGTIFIALIMLILLMSPYISSVLLSDQIRCVNRNLFIILMFSGLLLLDRLVRIVELISK